MPPGPPLQVTATAGNSIAAVTWQAPASDGGSPITSYTVTTLPGTQGAAVPAPVTVPASTTTTMVNGPTNGATYMFTVTATNAIGTGPASVASNPVTPVLQPALPNNTGATPTNLGTINCAQNVIATGDNTTGTHAWYQVTFNQAGFCTLTINLSGTPDLFDVHAGAFTTAPDPTATRVAHFTTTASGTYFIDVSGGTGGNTFTLAINAR
jgi:hypothetical protein